MENNMKKCPSCAEEIRKEAIKCPKCQKDLRNWFIRHWIISIILFIFIGIPFITGFFEGFYGRDDNNSGINNDISINNNVETKTIESKVDKKDKKDFEKYTGIWVKKYYVDEFGDKTSDSYITTKNILKGTFSNSATENSRLNIEFLINSENDINIQLYEYQGKNPVKEYRNESYTILIKTEKGEKIKLKGINGSDRLKFTNPIKMHNILLAGGMIKFKIIKDATVSSNYNFVIDNADGYNNLFKK